MQAQLASCFFKCSHGGEKLFFSLSHFLVLLTRRRSDCRVLEHSPDVVDGHIEERVGGYAGTENTTAANALLEHSCGQ